jgi:hypothetical protein
MQKNQKSMKKNQKNMKKKTNIKTTRRISLKTEEYVKEPE